jgi:ribosomal protein L34
VRNHDISRILKKLLGIQTGAKAKKHGFTARKKTKKTKQTPYQRRTPARTCKSAMRH